MTFYKIVCEQQNEIFYNYANSQFHANSGEKMTLAYFKIDLISSKSYTNKIVCNMIFLRDIQ